MPSTVLSACLILVVATVVHSDNPNLDNLEDFLDFYARQSNKLRNHGQMLDHLHYPDTSRPVDSQQNLDFDDLDTNDSLFHSNDVYSKPPSLAFPPSTNSISSKNLRAGSVTENQGEDDQISNRSFQPANSFNSMDKRAGLDDRKFLKELYYRKFHPNSNTWATRELKRERNGGMGPSLSVDSSLDVIRQRFMQGLIRNRMMEKQKQIESNVKLLSDIGKRDGSSQSSRSHLKQQPNH